MSFFSLGSSFSLTFLGVQLLSVLALLGFVIWRSRRQTIESKIQQPEDFVAWARATQPLYRSGPSIWLAIDASGKIVSANKPALDWFSLSESDSLQGREIASVDPRLAELAPGEFVLSYTESSPVHRKLEGWVHGFESSSEAGESTMLGRVITAVDRTHRDARGGQLQDLVTSLAGLSGDALIREAVERIAVLLPRARVFLAIPDSANRERLRIVESSSSDSEAELPLPADLAVGNPLWSELLDNACISYLRAFPRQHQQELSWVEGMVGMNMRDEAGELLGVLVILAEKPIADPFFIEGLMRLVLMRLRGELIERRQTRMLQRAHDYYKRVLDLVPVLIWQSQQDLQHRVVFNQTWMAFRGSEAGQEEDGGWLDGLHPSERDAVVARLESFAEKKQAFEHIYRLRKLGGQYRWILEKGHPHYDEHGEFLGFFGACTDITVRHSSERELRIFKAAFESTSSGVVIAREETKGVKVIYCNESYCRLKGVPSGIIVGKHFLGVLGQGSRQEYTEQIENLFLSGRTGSVECEVAGVNGNLRWLRYTLTPIAGPTIEQTHWVCIASEITNERQEQQASIEEKEALALELFEQKGALNVTERELRSEADERRRVEQNVLLLRSALDHVDIPTVMVRNDGNVVYINDASRSALSLQLDETIYHKWFDPELGSEWAVEDWSQLIMRLVRSEIGCQDIKVDLLCDSAQTKTYEVRLKHVFFDGDDFVTCIFVDLSESLEAQGELIAQTDALLRASELKSEFVAKMSHELRTPLNSILMLSEALLSNIYGKLNGAQQKSLKTLEDSGQHLLALINDILDLSKVEAGKLEIRKEKVDVSQFCKEIIDAFKEQAKVDQIDVRLEIDRGVSFVEMDKRRFRQILVNLIGNALDFTPRGGVVTLEVLFDDLDDEITFAVTDTGPGIPEKDHTKLFEPFVQLDSGNTRQREGSGLGLSLAREFAELHGGRIELSSEVGAGSRFAVIVPLPHFDARALGLENTSKSRKPFEVDGSLGEELTVMVVDDHLGNQDLVKEFLISCGYQVLTAPDGRIAVEKAISLMPDVILMDIQMPVMDGYEAMRLIRRDPVGSRIGIIAMTALAMEGDKEACLAAGADDYISKPIRLSELTERIDLLVARKV